MNVIPAWPRSCALPAETILFLGRMPSEPLLSLFRSLDIYDDTTVTRTVRSLMARRPPTHSVSEPHGVFTAAARLNRHETFCCVSRFL